MEVIELATGRIKEAIISPVLKEDFKKLTKRQYFFDWKACSGLATIYKLQVEGQKEILGVMGLIDIPREERIEIKLIAAAKENQGKRKKFDRVISNLIAFACWMARLHYGINGCVSLLPKSILAKHYMQKYYMNCAGQQLYLDGRNLNLLLKEYPS